MKKQFSNQKERGGAVISAMLIAAFVAITASVLLHQNQLAINQLESHLSLKQARLIADASFEWSRVILFEEAKLGNIDHLKEPWATKIPPTQFESGIVQGYITDAQAFCNINNVITDEEYRQDLKKFFELLGEQGLIIDGLVDWADPDSSITQPNGAEDDYYLTQAFPYRTANQALTELGNLSRVKGFNQALIEKLAQYCVALPENTPLNINTASPEVIKLTFPELTAFDVESIITKRNIRPFENTNEIATVIENPAIKLNSKRISVSSRYFMVNTQVQFGKTTLHASALLKRDGLNWPKIIWKRYT